MKNIPQTKLPYQPNKALGQNFIFDKNYLHKIVNSISVDNETIIIEIGSGYGNLTNLLGETTCQKIISLEKDKNLFQWLEKNNKNDKITYLCQDALLVDWKNFCLEYQNNSLIIVGNLPYYLTNSLIVNLLLSYQKFKSLVFLIQKEVARKWVASINRYNSKYSALSVFINYLAKIKLVFEVPREIFTPIPEVDGALLIINPHEKNNISKEQLTYFLRFLKNCFRFRRKTLWNNLLNFANKHEKNWEKYFHEKGYSSTIRPQNINPVEYSELFFYWQKLKS